MMIEYKIVYPWQKNQQCIISTTSTIHAAMLGKSSSRTYLYYKILAVSRCARKRLAFNQGARTGQTRL